MENSKEMGIPDHLTYLLRNLYAGEEATLRTGHGTSLEQTGSKQEKEYIKAVYCHPAFLTYHEKHWAGGRISWNQDRWEKYQ